VGTYLREEEKRKDMHYMEIALKESRNKDNGMQCRIERQYIN
jgi:hypothetical protein